ncbi:MAG: DUF4331 family protein [Bacteroidetes bacterium]|nr:DUF4331 family protein [Bacteroidota bacterium]
MKKTKIFATIGGFSLLVLSVFLISSDHIDAPNVAGTSTDIADFYAFEGDNPNNTVFIATLQGILSPGGITENATFDEDVLIEFNIDNTGDFVEDLVIQVIKRDSVMYFFGPIAPSQTGLESEIMTSTEHYIVEISTTENTIVTSENGMSFFAGPRRDAFYFDFNRFNDVASGAAAPEGFYPLGESEDFFKDLNTLAIVVEVPNALLGTAPTHVLESEGNITGLPPAYNVWVSAKRKQ